MSSFLYSSWIYTVRLYFLKDRPTVLTYPPIYAQPHKSGASLLKYMFRRKFIFLQMVRSCFKPYSFTTDRKILLAITTIRVATSLLEILVGAQYFADPPQAWWIPWERKRGTYLPSDWPSLSASLHKFEFCSTFLDAKSQWFCHQASRRILSLSVVQPTLEMNDFWLLGRFPSLPVWAQS